MLITYNKEDIFHYYNMYKKLYIKKKKKIILVFKFLNYTFITNQKNLFYIIQKIVDLFTLNYYYYYYYYYYLFILQNLSSKIVFY